MAQKRAKNGKSGIFARRPWLRRLGITIAVAGGAVAFALVILFLIFAADPDLPRITSVADYHPKVVTKVMSADGELIGEIFEERRTLVPRQQIPAVMIHAIVDADGEYIGATLIGGPAALPLADALEATWRRDPARYYEDGYQELADRGVTVAAAPIGEVTWVEVDDHNDLRRAREIAGHC